MHVFLFPLTKFSGHCVCIIKILPSQDPGSLLESQQGKFAKLSSRTMQKSSGQHDELMSSIFHLTSYRSLPKMDLMIIEIFLLKLDIQLEDFNSGVCFYQTWRRKIYNMNSDWRIRARILLWLKHFDNFAIDCWGTPCGSCRSLYKIL